MFLRGPSRVFLRSGAAVVGLKGGTWKQTGTMGLAVGAARGWGERCGCRGDGRSGGVERCFPLAPHPQARLPFTDQGPRSCGRRSRDLCTLRSVGASSEGRRKGGKEEEEEEAEEEEEEE